MKDLWIAHTNDPQGVRHFLDYCPYAEPIIDRLVNIGTSLPHMVWWLEELARMSPAQRRRVYDMLMRE